MGSSCQKDRRDDRQESEDATAFRVKGNNVEVILDDVFFLKPLSPEAAEVVLWAHKTDFDPNEHWYEYLMGAATEGSEILGLHFPVLRQYGGFVEIFRWDEGIALESLYVLFPFRNRGVGTATVLALEMESKNRLSIWASKISASFYERLGYRRDVTQGGYIMTKNRYPGKSFTEAAAQYWRTNG